MIYIALLVIIILSARWNWWRPKKNAPAILMYHKIGIPPAGSKLEKLWVTPAKFTAQMRYLKKMGYSVFTFRQINEMLENGRVLPEKCAVITFDDGYKNNYMFAMPILSEFGFPCVIFIVSEAVNRDNFWHDPSSETRIDMMNESELTDLLRRGVEIGSHTKTHKNLSKIDIQEAEREISQSKKDLERIFGREIISFAYPYGGGAFVREIQDAVKNTGYSFAVSVKQGKSDITKERFCLRRIFIRGDDNMLDFHLNLTRGKSRF